MISPDIGTETRFKYPPLLIENGVKAVASVVIIGGHGRPPFGILQIDSRKTRQFTETDTAFLRSSVVETPIEEQVTLRDETIHVERRPLSDTDFRERLVEMPEIDEEVVMGKAAVDRVETLRNTVRHTKVDVEPILAVETTRTANKLASAPPVPATPRNPNV